MKLITYEQVTCRYELSWRKKPQTLIIKIHQDLMMALKECSADIPVVRSLTQEFGFLSFTGNFADEFGFEGAIRRRRDKGEYAEFHIPIPKIRIRTGRECPECKGTGRRNTGSGECLRCDGGGKEHDYEWHKANAISASLTVLFELIDFSDVETSGELSQLLTVYTITARGEHGGSLGGMYGVELVDWLSHFKPNTELVEMVEAMRLAYGHMLGRRYFDTYRFRASVDSANGWLNISCPGDACGLNPADGYLRPGNGYRFSCHNVDNPAQQLTLLAGLAALHDKARKEMAVY